MARSNSQTLETLEGLVNVEVYPFNSTYDQKSAHKALAFIRIHIGEFFDLNDARLMESPTGEYWMSLPSRKDEKSGKYRPYYFIPSEDLHDSILGEAIAQYSRQTRDSDAPKQNTRTARKG